MMERETKVRIKMKAGKLLIAFLSIEMFGLFWMNAYLLGQNSRRISLPDAYNNGIGFVLFHDAHRFHSRCCLNNLLMSVIAGQIQQGCDLAKRTNTTTAVLLPSDLDGGGSLRLSSNSSFSMYDDESITELKRLARDKLNCLLLSEEEVTSAGIPKVHYQRPSERAQMMQSRGPLHRWTYRNMVLPPSLRSVYSLCYGNVTSQPRYLAVHMRIESDWYPYCEKRSHRVDGVNACYTPTQIARAVSSLDFERVVLIHGKIHRQFKAELPRNIWQQINPQQSVYHKSWSQDCERALQNLTYNEVALVDFWVSIQADAFVGTHLSTFSNMVTYVRESRGKYNSSYLYSCPDSPIMLRLDGGLLVRNASDRQRCYLSPKTESSEER